ncbi:MAG: site-specific tyrosine recombinase/integron integrase [Bacilli bacterium]|nr:site-specific tyrosine recombinase/integron integrase [Bacilli bacterium]
MINDIELNRYKIYLKTIKKFSDNTIDAYIHDLLKLKKFTKKDLIKTTKSDLEKFNKTLNELDPKSKARVISSIKSFYKYEMIKGNVCENISNVLIIPKFKKSIPDILSIEEVDKLLDIEVIDHISARNKAMLELMYASGLRVTELINLKPNDVDLENNTVRTMGKGKKERIIPIGDYATVAVKNYLYNYRPDNKKCDYLFLNNHYNQMTRQGFFKVMKKLLLEKGINIKFSPHTLRHSFASHMLSNGADLRTIQELLGHSNISTTEIYLYVNSKEIRKNYDNAHPHA